MNPFTHFVRARLHRRIFLYFGVTILFTLLGTLGVMKLGSDGENTWAREVSRVQAFLGGRFERVWDDPPARAELASELARDLDLTVELIDANGAVLSRDGKACAPGIRTPVRRGEQPIGAVVLCADRHHATTSQILAPLLMTAFIVWAMAGILAFRLAWPLGELARVAKDIGEGRFSSRACLGRHHHGEYGIVGRVINDMAARIERQLNEQRELLATVSHELRTPLARIRLLTEMSRGKADDKTLDELDREVMEIDALVGDLLASSRMDFQAIARRRLDAAEQASRALERAGVDPTALVVEAEGAKVDADPTLLGRALANLIDNAKKHGGGVDALRVRKTGETLAFEVEDHGEGFEDGEASRIFEPFYRRGENGSLGLGLALVKRIAEAHGGRAFAANREQGGACVGLELPLKEAA